MTTSLFKHQEVGIDFLFRQPAAMLADEMGLGKSRQALLAALRLSENKKIERILILCPAAVRYSWAEEMKKVDPDKKLFKLHVYRSKDSTFVVHRAGSEGIEVCIISYGLLTRENHIKPLEYWVREKKTVLICDESSFVSNRTAKTTKGVYKLAHSAPYRWLLNGTPITNSPLDMWAQGMIMMDGKKGPLNGFQSYFHFRGKYGVMGGFKMKQVVEWRYLDDLQRRFKPYILRREKRDCLDLPPKTYVTRDVTLDLKTWAIYQNLRKEALLALPDTDEIPEPNAAIRLMRLMQITSGFVTHANPEGGVSITTMMENQVKSTWLAMEMKIGEMAGLNSLIVWCRWRVEREHLAKLLTTETDFAVHQIYGGQSQVARDQNIAGFQNNKNKRVMLGQQHAGGFGITLTAASYAVYLSNDYSFVARVQSEARIDRIGQEFPMTYMDVLARGPEGQETMDHHGLRILQKKDGLATMTCRAWRRLLSED